MTQVAATQVRKWKPLAFVAMSGLAALAVCLAATGGRSDGPAGNLVRNSDFKAHGADASARTPANYALTGDVEYRYLGDPNRDMAGWGVAFQSAPTHTTNAAARGSVAQTVTGIDAKAGRWYRFSFRGLPQDNFGVTDDDLAMEAAFFGDAGRTAMDAKAKRLYPLIEQARHDLGVNGIRHAGGAAVWRTYGLDFYLPFPQVDTVRLSVAFGHGSGRDAPTSAFFITDFSLMRIDGPEPGKDTGPSADATAQAATLRPAGTLLPLGGRWYYQAKAGETQAPSMFNATNADRLFYNDAHWTTPFAGEMTAWLRAGYKDASGNVVSFDRLVPDNVTVSFDATSMIVHTKGLPNHPTGKFPETTYGRGRGNPSYIQEQQSAYYIPLNPTENPNHTVTATDNSNHALPMGPIGVAVNGVVFFNPFDMGNQDATDLMDRCCGHPNPNNQYHYHKYPICLNSPWADEGNEHSPLIGWAFDGYPVYGPYESAGVMAKDMTGPQALNGFNMHWDKDRGWHYHVTPGKLPYILGGYWGTEDSRDKGGPGRRGGPPGAMGNRPPPPRGGPRGGPPGDGPPGDFGGGPPPGPPPEDE